MRVEDLIVEVRDRDLVRVGQVDPRFLTGALFAPRKNDAGDWQLVLPTSVDGEPYAECAALQEPGAGIIVTVGDDVLMSGLVDYKTCDSDPDDLDGTWTFTGDTDTGLVADSRAYPQPTNADPTTQTAVADVRSGKAETVLHAYVNANIGPGAPAGRKTGTFRERIVMGVDGARGETRQAEANFARLDELGRELFAGTALMFRIAQIDDDLVFETSVGLDLSADWRFDIANDQLRQVSFGSGAPQITQAIVAASGESRAIAAATDTTADAAYGRRREAYIPGSSSDVVELQVQALNTLQENAAAGAFTVVPAEGLVAELGVTNVLGALVTVVVGEDELPAYINQVAVSVTEAGVSVGVALGDDDGTDWEGQVTRSLDSLGTRVSLLERAEGLPDRLSPLAQEIADWNDATEVGFYWGRVGIPNSPEPSGASFSGVVFYDGNPVPTRLIQELRTSSATHSRIVTTWRRTLVAGVWGSWYAVNPVHDGGTIAHTLNPPDFPVGLTIGQADASYPSTYSSLGGALATVEVVKYNSTRAVQRTSSKGDGLVRTWQRGSASDGSTWGPWSIEGQLIALGVANLNDVITTGSYVQGTSAEATLARNYPFTRAGYLEVFTNESGANVGIMQRYTDFRGLDDPNAMGIWVRTWYNTWGAWVRVDGGKDTGWQALSPASGWTFVSNFGYRIKNEILYLRGEFYGGADGSTVFTLPAGARPTSRIAVPVTRVSNGTTDWRGNLVIQTTGVATYNNTGTPAILTGSPGYAVGNISFPVTN